jgi:hypothetical protein
MQQKKLILTCAGAFLLVLGSTSYGADPASHSPTMSSPEQVYLIRKNPFFIKHIEKAVQHAREAEIAGNMGESLLLQEHAKISLMQAREAQRAGNVPGLNEGIANLKKALTLPTGLTQTSTQASSAEGTDKSLSETQRAEAAVHSATDAVREARKNLSEAGGLKYKEIQPQAVKTVSQ